MAFDGFIQIADIPGEALDEKYSKWIEITGYNFGVNQSTSATASSSGGASSGRTTMTNFTFTKYLDSASCKLMEASCAGQHLKEVKLVLCRAGTDKLKYYEVVLEEVIIADYTQSASSGSLSKSYSSITAASKPPTPCRNVSMAQRAVTWPAVGTGSIIKVLVRHDHGRSTIVHK
ncbi:hypothetical protein CVE36_12085, partial [Pseudomonas syringae pv. actinidiae]|nr:hypothetical protein [Pseudomonas syringae pv. actinidiae]